MFTQSGRIYDLLYGDEGSAFKAQFVRDVIGERTSGALSLLDVACGTGGHLVGDQLPPPSSSAGLIKNETETYVMGLFSIDGYRQAFEEAGLRAKYDEDGTTGGLWIVQREA